MNDNADLKAIMADFMQSILTSKPNNVVEFAAKYFAPHSSKTKSNQLLAYLNQKTNLNAKSPLTTRKQ